MRILLAALPLLLLLSGCATVDGEQVALDSVMADEATLTPCDVHMQKKLLNPVEQIREGVRTGNTDLVEKGRKRIVNVLTGNMTWGQRYADAYLQQGRVAGAHKMAADVVMGVMGEMEMPRVVDAVRHGFPVEWLIPGEQTQALYGHLIPAKTFQFTTEGEPVSSVQLAPTPAAPGQRPAGVAPCPHARLTRFQMRVWTGEQEAQGTQPDETLDFTDAQSGQQQHSVLQSPQQLIPGGRLLLGPIMPNAYGPGLNSDATGKPFIWHPDFGGPALGPITPNAYGPGVGMDATGRPVRPACPPGMWC
jgi:hypothetical protein